MDPCLKAKLPLILVGMSVCNGLDFKIFITVPVTVRFDLESALTLYHYQKFRIFILCFYPVHNNTSKDINVLKIKRMKKFNHNFYSDSYSLVIVTDSILNFAYPACTDVALF